MTAAGDLEERVTLFLRCIEQRDAAIAEDILDDDYALVVVQPTPVVMPRARWLEVLPDYVVHTYDVQERRLDVDGDCAAMVHRVFMEATVLGQERNGVFVISDVWRRRDGTWRVWRRHSTPLSAGEMPGA